MKSDVVVLPEMPTELAHVQCIGKTFPSMLNKSKNSMFTSE